MFSPLIAACAHRRIQVVKLLLDQPNVQPEMANPSGHTPLMFAAGSGCEQAILMFLKLGANRNATDCKGRTALDWARKRAKQLADKGAASRGFVHVLRVDPKRDSVKDVCAEGDVDGLVALMKQDAPVNVLHRGHPTETALIAAATNYRRPIMTLLLDHPHIQADLPDSSATTPLIHAAVHGHEEAVLMLLLKGSANRYAKNAKGEQAVDLAVRHGHLNIAGILSADPERVAIQHVAKEGRICVLEGLIKQGVDVNQLLDGASHSVEPRLATALIAAAAFNQRRVIKRLLEHPQIQVNKQNAFGETALMHAAAVGATEACRELLKAGANSDITDRSGATAVNWAGRFSFSHMVWFMSARLLN